MCEAYVNAMLLKPGVDSEVTKHLASASEPSAKPTSQLCLLIKSETSYDTSMSKWGWGHSAPLLKLPCSALNEICSKPRGSLRETQTKIKGPFFFFFFRRRSHILSSLCSLPCCCCYCCCWAEQGAENCLARTLQHLTMRVALVITSTLTQWVEQYRGQW